LLSTTIFWTHVLDDVTFRMFHTCTLPLLSDVSDLF